MAEPIVIPSGGGEVIGDSADRTVLVLSDCDELHATWSRFGAGRDGAGLHIHREHTDLFYVLEGELTVKLADDEEIAAGAGTLVTIPPLVVHGFRNASDADVKYLNLHAPGCGFIGYMRGLRDGEPSTSTRPIPRASRACCRRAKSRSATRGSATSRRCRSPRSSPSKALRRPSRTPTPTTWSRTSCSTARWAS